MGKYSANALIHSTGNRVGGHYKTLWVDLGK